MAGKPKGGRRPGAGRPRGLANKRTREIADQAAREGITPLEVKLRTMRHLWGMAVDDDGKIIDVELAKQACEVADSALRFVHPTLASVDYSGDMTIRHEDALGELE